MAWLESPLEGNIYASGSRPVEDKTIYVNPVDGGTDAAFADASNDVVISNDTDNVQCFLTNKRSLKFTSDGTGNWVYGQENFAVAKDLSTAYGMLVRFYVHEGISGTITDFMRIERAYITVMTDAGNTSRYRIFKKDLTSGSAGWHTVIIPRSMPVGVDGALNWASVASLHFGMEPTNVTDTVAITVDEISFLPKMSTARVYPTFDDGHASHYEIAQRMNYYGLKGTFFIMTNAVGTANYVTWNQLAEMRDAGHLIANHCMNNDPWSGMSEATKIAEVIGAQEALADHQHYEGQRILATPGGELEWPFDGESIVGSKVDVIRGLWPIELDVVSTYRPYGMNRRIAHTAECANLTDDTNRDLHETAVTNAITDGCCAVLCLHDMADAAQFTRLDHILQHIKTAVDADTLDCGVLSQVQTIT